MIDREKLSEKDEILICKNCREEFVFLESEQRFYNKMGFKDKPKRCFSCRRTRKQKLGE